MLDNAADVNVLLQSFALKSRLRKVDMLLPSIEGFRREKGYCYSVYKVTLRLTDSIGTERRTEHIFFRVNLNETDLLLSRP